MSKETGKPAFPYSFVACPTEETFVAQGMTLRDYFAAKAMQALLARLRYGIEDDPTDVATVAYNYADAMLKAREQ